MTELPEPESFTSGESGRVAGPRLVATRTLADRALDAAQMLGGTRRRLDRLAAATPPVRVLVLCVYRPRSALPAAAPALRSARHEVVTAYGSIGPAAPALRAETVAEGLEGGKFENLNRLLAQTPGPAAFDWTLAVDDDVRLPARFLDRFLAVCERFGLDLAQPAQTLRSHAAWRVTRRRAGSAVRETRFVEIGPVTAFGRRAGPELMPFPELRFGWGLDLHWAALARDRGWRCGIVDALPVRHESTPVASAYPREAAVEEGRRFLAGRPYLHSGMAQEILATHRRLP